MFNRSWMIGALAVLTTLVMITRADADYVSLGGSGFYPYRIQHVGGGGGFPGGEGMNDGYYSRLAAQYLTAMEKAVKECRKEDFDHNLRNLMALEEIAHQKDRTKYDQIPKDGGVLLTSDSAYHEAVKAEADAADDFHKLSEIRFKASLWWVGCPKPTGTPSPPPSCPTPSPTPASGLSTPKPLGSVLRSPASQGGMLAQGPLGCPDTAATRNSLGVRLPKPAKPGRDDSGRDDNGAGTPER